MVNAQKIWDIKNRYVEVKVHGVVRKVQIWNQPYLYKGPNDKIPQKMRGDAKSIQIGVDAFRKAHPFYDRWKV